MTIQGTGSFTNDADPRFGKVFSNAASESPRSNYLLLPSTTFSAFSAEGGKSAMTISFWVNAKNAGEASAYTYAPLFAAYSAAPAEGVNTLPMICLQSRGLIQINNAGWCDFGPELNKDSKNNIYNTNAWEVGQDNYTSGGNWLDDSNWHLYTLTLTATQATVYLDGVVKNQWNLDGTKDGQVISGMFTSSATNLTYVCLGGNQAWNLGDNDAAFMFDDFAVYDVALSAEQIAQIMTDKTTTADITAIPSNYTFDASSSINPFDNGAIWHGTNVDAFLPSISSDTRSLTATAYFDSDTSTGGRQAYTVSSGDVVTISMLMYNGYCSAQSSNATSYSIYNSDGTAIVSFVYNSSSCNITDVTLGGTTAEGFEAFSGQSAYNASQGANGINEGSKPFVTTSGYNPVITISIAGDGNVSINFVRSKTTSYDKTFSAKLSDVKMDLAKIVMSSSNYGKGGTNNGDRISGIGYMNFGLTHTVNVRAVDGSKNELATISTHKVADGNTLQYAYPRYVLDGMIVYKKDKQSNNEYRITSGAINASQTIDVVYSQYATDGYFFTEAENLDGVTVVTNSGASSRTSMAAAGRGTDIAVTTLPVGSYKVAIGWYGKSGETCTIMAGDKAVVSATQNGSWGETFGDSFNLTEPTAITMTATGTQNYTGIDYILIEKTGETTTVSTVGYSTLASDYDLDFSSLSSSLIAYKATINGTKITFTAVNTVPAGEGVLLRSVANLTESTFDIPVTTGVTAWAAGDNAFVRGTNTAVATSDGGYYNYVLSTKNGVPGFYQAGDNIVPDNKAYLQSTTNAARISLIFDEANGIEAIEGGVQRTDNDVYNMNGQRVAAPTKGLYIMNGKKVIYK